jgi:hypothetical protein
MADPGGVAAGGVVPIEACSCVTDPFAAVPPELQPRPQKRDSLRKVGCPGCGKEYFTNREKDLCISCERIENEGRGSQESK